MPAGKAHDVVGICTAMVDLQARAEPEELAAAGVELDVGRMRVIDLFERGHVLAALEARGGTTTLAGGSVANSIATVGLLGGRACMAGCVAPDGLGDFYLAESARFGVRFVNNRTLDGTGTCVVLTHGDGQRSMLSYLGAAKDVYPTPEVLAACRNAKAVFIEGYLADAGSIPEGVRSGLYELAGAARAAGGEAVLSLSDASCVGRNGPAFRRFLDEGLLSGLFANAEEASVLTGERDPRAATDWLGRRCRGGGGGGGWAVVTDGCEARPPSPSPTPSVPAVACPEPLDSTGAGDAYAGAVLYGLYSAGWSLREAAAFGASLAARVVARFGARLPPGEPYAQAWRPGGGGL
eukprot:tig00021168_g19095.t1